MASPSAAGGVLRLVHLSDLHIFTAESAKKIEAAGGLKLGPHLRDLERHLELLSQSLERIATKELPLFKGASIVVTGDIAYSASPKEYERAKKFLDKVRTALGREGTIAPLFLTPGNHDLNRKERECRLDDMDSISRGDHDRAKGIYDLCLRGGATSLKKGQKAYFKFERNACTTARAESNSLFYVHTMQLDGGRTLANFISLNSAYLYGGPVNYLGFLGRHQVTEAFDKAWNNAKVRSQGQASAVGPAAVNIVFFHHPFEAQAEPDQQIIEDMVLDNASLLLTGHVHQHRVLQRIGDGVDRQSLPIISASRCVFDEYNDPQIRPGYSLFELDYDERGVREIRVYQVLWNRDTDNWGDPRGPRVLFARAESGSSLRVQAMPSEADGTGASNPPGKARRIWSLGNRLFEAGDLPGAIECYDAAIELAPGYEDPRFNKALALLLTGRGTDAIPILQDLSRTSRSSDVMDLLAIASEREGPDRAEAFYVGAIESYPRNAAILGNYAIFLSKVRKDSDRAEEFYKRAIEADPKHANNLGNYAVFLSKVRKDSDRAEEFFRRAIEADPKDANSLANFCGFLYARGDLYEAAGIWSRAHSTALETSSVKNLLELWFYAFANGPAETRRMAVVELKQLLTSGVRSAGWDLTLNVSRAEETGHPESKWVRVLAAVIAGTANLSDLATWEIWESANS